MDGHSPRHVQMTLVRSPSEVGLTIPTYVPLPSGLPFVHFTRADRTIYVSGHIPDTTGEPQIRGRLGKELGVEEGRLAAVKVTLNLLATLEHAAGGLDRVRRILKLVGFVASAEDFVDQPSVINAASEIFEQLWGEFGLHARSAIGVAQLPFGVPVEIELVAELEDEE
jgi:enamine deaminase RidA (YjgF/YER057c/UK114 family)